MPKSDIATKARQLLSRRTAPSSAWYYVRRDWRRQSVFLMAYIAIPIVLLLLDMKVFAIAAAGFLSAPRCEKFVGGSRWPENGLRLRNS